MRILLVHDYGTATGGAELQMLGLRQGLRGRGHQVRLLTSRARAVPGDILADYQCYGTTTRLQKLSQVANPSAFRQLGRALREFRPDVVHVRLFLWQLSPLILPLLEEVPSLYQAAMYKSICPTGTKMLPDGRPCLDPAGLACLRHRCLTPMSWPLMMLQRQLWLRWRHVFRITVGLSEFMKRRLEAEGIGPVEVVHNGVAERPMREPLSGPPLVAFAGRLAPEKGVEVLAGAMARVVARLPEARLIVAGAGPLTARFAALVDEAGLSGAVTILGHLPRAELERRCEAAWVQVVPSLWDEPFGNVATEAMMRGTAVVASDVGALPEIVRDGETGLLVRPGSPDTLAEGLLRLLGDRELAERMGRAGRDRALACFSADRCVNRFLQLYQRLQAHASGGAPAPFRPGA